jgi:hypothetical protein
MENNEELDWHNEGSASSTYGDSGSEYASK